MPRYLCTAKLNATGLAAIRTRGYARHRNQLQQVWSAAGCTIESVWFGSPTDDADVLLVVDAPSSDPVFSLAFAAMAGGGAIKVRAFELRSAEDADALARMDYGYRAPEQPEAR